MSDPAEDLLEGIGSLLRLFTVNETRFPPAEGRIKYNGLDFNALRFIEDNPGCKSKELADFIGIAPTTAQSTIDRLIKRGFVLRGPHKISKRAVGLTLTEEGAAVRAAIHRQDLSNMRAMLAVIPENDRAKLAAQIKAISEALNNPA